MYQAKKDHSHNTKSAQLAGANTPKSLINDLGSKESAVRMKAHKAIAGIGEPAAGLLVEALSNSNERVRWEAEKLLDELKIDWHEHADDSTINALIADLGSKDGLARVKARLVLVTIGTKAVPALEEALASKDELKRWEATKALSQIGAPEATGVLIKALEDNMFDVRWLAAEGLVAIGRPALAPLLRKLTEKPDSLSLREGVHHILHGIDKRDLEGIIHPVLKALEGDEAPLEAPFAAETSLKLLSGIKPAI